mgnify:CR=1 FL=1
MKVFYILLIESLDLSLHYGDKIVKFQEALSQLKETRKLYTSMLEPLGIGFESWLRFAQLSDTKRDQAISKLIKILELKSQTS